MMTRRECLVRMFGAAVAAAVAPLVNLQDTTPAFWNQPEIKKLIPWSITFGDGTKWSFDGVVVAEKLLKDGEISLTVQPSGPMTMHREDKVVVSEPVEPDDRFQPITADGNSYDVTLEGAGKKLILEDISLPALSREVKLEGGRFNEDSDNYVLGQLKTSPLVFTVKFDPEQG